jgi:hypothetical protein
MLTVAIEIPSGAISQPRVAKDEDAALKRMERYVKIMTEWKDYIADVILYEDNVEISRSYVRPNQL